jgi:regulator of RNase E activity RraB
VARKRSRVVYDEWETYHSQSESGPPLFVSFDVQAAREDLTRTLRHCARVIVPIRNPNKNGGPVQPESDRLYAMEDELCAALADDGVRCRLVGRLTCDGVREIVFQLDDWHDFRAVVGRWMRDNDGYRTEVSEHDGWKFFNDVIRPNDETWLYISDRGVVRQLVEAGSNPEKIHAIDYVFHGQVPELKRMLNALEERGYTAPNGIDEEAEELVAVKKMMLDVDDIFAESLANQQLAEEHEAAYDGWGAMVVK